MSDVPKTRGPGRPRLPGKERLSHVLPGARFDDVELAQLQRRAKRVGLRFSQWCRSALEDASLSVPDLGQSTQERLLKAGQELNDVVRRLHTQSDEVSPADLQSVHQVLLEHREVLQAARGKLT